MIRYRVHHITRYDYLQAVSFCHNEIRLLPAVHPQQNCLHSELRIRPNPVAYRERQDYFGNRVSYFSIEQSHEQMIVEAISLVEVKPKPFCVLPQSLPWEQVVQWLERDRSPERLHARQFCFASAMVPRFADLGEFAADCFTPGRPVLDGCAALMQKIFQGFAYKPGETNVQTSVAEVLTHRKGVCQDFAHLAIACLRYLGLAAIYISGYLETFPPPGEEKLVGSDASHAWFAVYVPQLGWVEFDPTNNVMPNEHHLRLASGRDYQDVAPLKGVVYGGGKHQLKVSVDVARDS